MSRARALARALSPRRRCTSRRRCCTSPISPLHLPYISQEVYIKEEVEWNFVAYEDNQPVIDLIAKRPICLLGLLDEQCATGSGTDASALANFHQTFTPGKKYAAYEKQERRSRRGRRLACGCACSLLLAVTVQGVLLSQAWGMTPTLSAARVRPSGKTHTCLTVRGQRVSPASASKADLRQQKGSIQWR